MPVRPASRATWISHRLTCSLRAVLVIGQVEGGIGEQVGSSGLARVWDRPQASGVEDVRDRPFGHYVHDPGLRDGEDIGSGQAGQRGGDFLAG